MTYFTYRGQDITLDILFKIEKVVSMLAEKRKLSFDEMFGIFLKSKTYKALVLTESCMWSESSDFICDEFLERG